MIPWAVVRRPRRALVAGSVASSSNIRPGVSPQPGAGAERGIHGAGGGRRGTEPGEKEGRAGIEHRTSDIERPTSNVQRRTPRRWGSCRHDAGDARTPDGSGHRRLSGRRGTSRASFVRVEPEVAFKRASLRDAVRFGGGYRALKRPATFGCRSATAGVWSGRRGTCAWGSGVRGASAEDTGRLRPSFHVPVPWPRAFARWVAERPPKVAVGFNPRNRRPLTFPSRSDG